MAGYERLEGFLFGDSETSRESEVDFVRVDLVWIVIIFGCFTDGNIRHVFFFGGAFSSGTHSFGVAGRGGEPLTDDFAHLAQLLQKGLDEGCSPEEWADHG